MARSWRCASFARPRRTSTASGGSHREFAPLSPGLPPLATSLPIGSTITPWAFAPHGLKATDIVFESATLAVRLPRHDDIFLMKLAAAREQDRIDLIALWPFCSFGSAAAAVTAFHERIPMADDDPYLIDYVSEIIEAAEH